MRRWCQGVLPLPAAAFQQLQSMQAAVHASAFVCACVRACVRAPVERVFEERVVEHAREAVDAPVFRSHAAKAEWEAVKGGGAWGVCTWPCLQQVSRVSVGLHTRRRQRVEGAEAEMQRVRGGTRW